MIDATDLICTLLWSTYLPIYLPTYPPIYLPSYVFTFVWILNLPCPLSQVLTDWLKRFSEIGTKTHAVWNICFRSREGAWGWGGVLQGVGNRADLGRLGAMMKFMGGKRAFITFANIVRSYMCPTLQLQVITDSNQCTKDETASCN